MAWSFEGYRAVGFLRSCLTFVFNSHERTLSTRVHHHLKSAGLTECGSHWASVSLLQTWPFLSVLWYILNANCAPIFTLLCTVNILELWPCFVSDYLALVSDLLSFLLLLARHFSHFAKVCLSYTVLKTEVGCIREINIFYFDAVYLA